MEQTLYFMHKEVVQWIIFAPSSIFIQILLQYGIDRGFHGFLIIWADLGTSYLVNSLDSRSTYVSAEF